MFKHFLLMATVAATMSASVPASSFAGKDEEVVTSVGLDLRTEQGRVAFLKRIEHAARHVCGQRELHGSDWYDADQYCMKETLAAANARAGQIFARLDNTKVQIARANAPGR